MYGYNREADTSFQRLEILNRGIPTSRLKKKERKSKNEKVKREVAAEGRPFPFNS